MEELGIVYKCYKIRDGLYILDPKKILEGYSVGENFYYDSEKPYNTIDSLIKGDNEYIVDGITTYEVLMDHYDEYEDTDLVRDFYYAEEDDFLVVVQIKNGKLTKRKIKRQPIFDSKKIEIYDLSEIEPFVQIDSSTLNKLLEERDINSIKKTLERLQKKLQVSSKTQNGERIKGYRLENGKITDIKIDATGMKIAVNGEPITEVPKTPQILVPKIKTFIVPTFTLKGLEDYLNERILGHENEIREISTIVYNNYKAQGGDTIQSILIPGPTGVGKTETARLVCNYLGVPFKEIDCSNLVPEGIVGAKLADELRLYLQAADNDPIKVYLGILILDEFDKIALTGLDIKAAARFELLKFTEGKKYTFEVKEGGKTKTITIDTSRIMKFFLGAFSDVTESKNPIGFSGSIPTQIDSIEDMEKHIADNTRFEQELLSRIHHTIVYKDLTQEDKKRVILAGKNSIYAEMKRRILRDYGVTIEGDEDFAQGIIEDKESFKNGVRHLNNIIFKALNAALYELGTNEGKYKRLILTRDTASKRTFNLY